MSRQETRTRKKAVAVLSKGNERDFGQKTVSILLQFYIYAVLKDGRTTNCIREAVSALWVFEVSVLHLEALGGI